MTNARVAVRREQAARIWRAGVAAVDSESLVRNAIKWSRESLTIAGVDLAASSLGKLLVVGGGKAGAGMARGIASAFPHDWRKQHLSGWVNVPADCVPDQPVPEITLHAARPAGVNEPTEEGVSGTERILDLVSQLGPDDVCLVLISGGGSALLPAPVAGLTLEQKADVTRRLARAGADISELNTVRQSLSRIKGGGLLRACRAGQLITLIISDVVGDPLATIASGPTIPMTPDVDRAQAILENYLDADVVNAISPFLTNTQSAEAELCPHQNVLLGSNQVALDAARHTAETWHWPVESLGDSCTGTAREFGASLIERAVQHCQNSAEPWCLLAGGETTVPMSPDQPPGKGGRNQEVALSALQQLERLPDAVKQRITLLAGGTDGEDGPTDAAGGWADADALERFAAASTSIEDHLTAHNAYPALERHGALWKTGPTHTNVMDLTVVLVDGA